MSVGVGSKKRAAGIKTEPLKAETKATESKTVEKKAVNKGPVANSTAGKNFGLGEELPIFLM